MGSMKGPFPIVFSIEKLPFFHRYQIDGEDTLCYGMDEQKAELPTNNIILCCARSKHTVTLQQLGTPHANTFKYFPRM